MKEVDCWLPVAKLSIHISPPGGGDMRRGGLNRFIGHLRQLLNRIR